MAVSNAESASITAYDADNRIEGQMNGAMLRRSYGSVVTAADDSANSVLSFFTVPSNARVASVKLTCAVAATAGALNIGLYDTTANGGAVVDADLFASAYALTGSANSRTELVNESGEYTIAEQETMLWEVLGLSEDPQKDYVVAAVISTTFNGGPTAIALEMDYAI